MKKNRKMNVQKLFSREKPVKGLWDLLTGYKLIFGTTLFCEAIGVFTETSGFLLLKYFIDKVIINHTIKVPLYFFALAYIMLAVIRGFLSFVIGQGVSRTAEGIVRMIKNALFDHIQRLSFSYHDKMMTGELIQRVTSDIDAVRRFYSEQVLGIGRIFFLFSINFVTCLFIEWKLALISIVAVPFIIMLSSIFFKRISTRYDCYQDQDGKLQAVLQENLTGVRVVKAFARQHFEMEKFDAENKEKYRLGKKLLLSHTLYWPLSHLTCGIQTMIGLSTGAIMALNGMISIGSFIAYLGMIGGIIWPLQNLGRLITQLSTNFVSYKRLREIILEKRENIDHGLKLETPFNGDIRFDHVSFEYIKDIPVLKNISFNCQAGQVIALLGKTGSGKTTLVNLLPRFYDYTDGEIYLDEIPLKNYSKKFLRTHIGIVEQEPFLFSMSITENICYGVEREVSREEVEEAAKMASIHDSILTFPQGYETLVGERGVTLSGGQKQRVAIARTLLKNPKILILDDSTSSVDAETEEQIKNALEKLMRQRTTFVIAHRIQTLMHADLILVFKDGSIIQRGRHQDLIKEKGFYQHVFQLQNRIDHELLKESTNV